MEIILISKNRAMGASTSLCAACPTMWAASGSRMYLLGHRVCLRLIFQKVTEMDEKIKILLSSWSLTLYQYHTSFHTTLQKEELGVMSMLCSRRDESRSPGSMGKEENKDAPPLPSPPVLHPHSSFPSSLFFSLECQTISGSPWQTSNLFFLKSYPKNNEDYYTSFTAV